MREGMFFSRSPYRVSFFGGGTDYESWYRNRGGIVLSTTIDRYCHVSLRQLPPFFRHKSRIVYSRIEEVQHNGEIEHPVVRNCLARFGISEGLEIHHDGDLPGHSGIGSSSAFTLALTAAIKSFRGEELNPEMLAKEAIHVERDLCRENVGIQDQICSAIGGFNKIEIRSDGSFTTKPMGLSAPYLASFEKHFFLGFTGIRRKSSQIAGATIDAIEAGAAHENLSRIMEIATEADRILSREGELEELGNLLHASWLAKREICSMISTPDLDSLYERARAAGAWGGKLCGAGSGGFFLLMAPPWRQPSIRAALPEIKAWIPLKISGQGTEMITGGRQVKSAPAPLSRFRRSVRRISAEAPSPTLL